MISNNHERRWEGNYNHDIKEPMRKGGKETRTHDIKEPWRKEEGH